MVIHDSQNSAHSISNHSQRSHERITVSKHRYVSNQSLQHRAKTAGRNRSITKKKNIMAMNNVANMLQEFDRSLEIKDDQFYSKPAIMSSLGNTTSGIVNTLPVLSSLI